MSDFRTMHQMKMARLKIRLLGFLVAGLLPCTGAFAQTPPAGERGAAVQSGAIATAPVILDGEILFRLPGVSAYPPEARAKITTDAILELAKDPNFQPGTLQIQEQDGTLRIMGGTRLVVSVTDLDSAAEQLAGPLLAQVLVMRIDTAIREYRASRRPEAITRDAFQALAVAVGFAVAAFAFRRLWGSLERRTETFYKVSVSKTPAIGLGTADFDALWIALRSTLRLLRLAVVLVAALFALNWMLALFPWTREFSRRALELIIDPVSTMGTGLINSVPNLVFLVVLYFFTKLLLRLSQTFFAAVARGSVVIAGFYPEWALPTWGLIRVLIIIFFLVVGYPYMPGSGTEAFKGVSLLVGVILSVGSSGIIANILAGYSLIYRRVFQVGDRVQIGDVIGDVEQIRNQITKIRTLKNEDVIIPNSQILGNNVVNYSSLVKQYRLILHTTVGIGYETPWRQVEGMLLTAARRTHELLSDPPPFVLQKSLGDFAIVYELNVYCDQPHRQPQLYTQLHRNILDVFNEFGVQIMTPSYESDPPDPKVVPKGKWYESPAELATAGGPPTADDGVSGNSAPHIPST